MAVLLWAGVATWTCFMNLSLLHPTIWNEKTWSLPALLVFPFPMFSGKAMKSSTKRAPLKLYAFHEHVCSVAARTNISFCQKWKSLPVHRPLCLELISYYVRIPMDCFNKRQETYQIKFYGNLTDRQTPTAYGVKPVFGFEIWESECVFVAMHVWMAEVVIILV